MRILSWNIRCQNSSDDARGCGWSIRRQRVIDTIHALSPDVLAVQEAVSLQMDDLRSDLPEFDAVGTGRDDGQSAGEFCGLFFRRAKFQLQSERTRWLSLTPDVPSRGWDAVLNRITTSARLLDHETGLAWEVWNTHFDHMGSTARLESARFLRHELEQLPVPAILCGDFNASPRSRPILELASGTLRDARAHANQPPSGDLATFRGFDKPITGEEARIDFVFVSPQWTIESYIVPTPIFTDWPPASDHRPVLVELNLTQKP